jgi:hypothetical protein
MYPLGRMLLVAAVVAVAAVRSSDAFTPSSATVGIHGSSPQSLEATEIVEDFDTNNGDVEHQLNGRGLVQNLRSAQVTNMYGQLVSLGVAMGPGTSVVVFLRHLG